MEDTAIRWNNPDRERLIEQALNASTLPEIRQATQDLQHWTRAYPQDFGIVDAFEVLSHKQDYAEEREQEAELREAITASRTA